MSLLFTALLKVWGPILLICGCFYLWSRRSKSKSLAAVLHRVAVIGAVYYGVLIALIAAVLNICEGDVFQGVSNCAPMPDIIGRIVIGVGYSTTALAIFGCMVLVAIGAVVEGLQSNDPK